MTDYLDRRLHAWLCCVAPTFQSNLQRLPVHWPLLRKSQSMRPQGFPEFSHERSKAKFQKRFENYRAKKCKLTWLLVNCQSC